LYQKSGRVSATTVDGWYRRLVAVLNEIDDKKGGLSAASDR
jgi:hypothetical protein